MDNQVVTLSLGPVGKIARAAVPAYFGVAALALVVTIVIAVLCKRRAQAAVSESATPFICYHNEGFAIRR
jgi:hypothetical protein